MEWFLVPIPRDGLDLFRQLLALSLAIKFLVEWIRGYNNYLNPESYLWFLDRQNGSGENTLWWKIYRSIFYLRWIAVAGLLMGGHWSLVGWLLIVALYSELQIYFKYHTNLMLLLLFIVLVTPQTEYVPKIYYFLPCITVSCVYVFTAIHKLNPRFLSGQVVAATLRLLKLQPRRHFDHFMGGWIPHRYLMFLTVALELSLPWMLFSKVMFWPGVIVGAGMHLGFTLMFPMTLFHFSLLMISTYPLFLQCQLY